MKNKKLLISKILFFIVFLSCFSVSFGQTIRYQGNVRGGFATCANALVNATGGGEANGVAVNTAGGTSMSSYSDLVLPPGSNIVSAFLYVEGYVGGLTGGTAFTSVKFKVPGGAYVTLNSGSPGFKANTKNCTGLNCPQYVQLIFDVTSMMPANGYISTVTAGGNPGTTGRYSVADVAPFSSGNFGYGWTLYVIYTNPSSRYRNVTIGDANNTQSATITLNNLVVPSSGTVNAVVALTGGFGDDGLTDWAYFGQTGAGTSLTDPTTGLTGDILNSSIGFCANNNVSVDAALAGFPILMNGNFVARNPVNYNDPNGGTGCGANSTCAGMPQTSNTAGGPWYSYYYDSDILDASGILNPSPTPITATFTQVSGGGDAIGFGAYAVSVDVASALITKSLAPTAIAPGGTATYTWTIENTAAGALNLAGIGFTDNLPANIMIANPNGLVISGGTGETVTAPPGGTAVTLSGLSLGIGQTAIISVNVTNKAGQTNPSCATNPLAWTNSFSNLSGLTFNVANGVTPQCLIVSATLPIELLSFNAHLNNKTVSLNWATASEKDFKEFVIERGSGSTFTPIGSISAVGNSEVMHNYSFEDKNPSVGINYYRLKQVDVNGIFTFSNIVNVGSSALLNNVTITPTPIKGNAEITFNTDAETILKLRVYDMAGRVVMQFDRQANVGYNSTSIDISALSKGIYYLNVTSTEGLQQNVKLVKE